MSNEKKDKEVDGTLYLAFELGNKEWKLGFTVGLGQQPRRRTVKAGDLQGLEDEIKLAKKRFGLVETARVVSCYEAGRDGFWLHRYLLNTGQENMVIDAASIKVEQRAKRRKTDRLDLRELLSMLVRQDWGEKKVWQVVHVPSEEAEDKRHLHRQLASLKVDRTRYNNRIKGLLVTQGVRLSKLERVRLWDGRRLPAGLQARLQREYACLEFVKAQIEALEAQRRELIQNSSDPVVEMVRQLLRLKGIGENSAWLFVMEFFGWREFQNRRQVGGLAGLSPTPYQSGDETREQGIGKDGNVLVRSLIIEIAWIWVRHQPNSELSRWFEKRFADGNKRVRKMGIVAVARKLLIALWRYLQYGEIPAGAQLSL